jgi:hypothetical protein
VFRAIAELFIFGKHSDMFWIKVYDEGGEGIQVELVLQHTFPVDEAFVEECVTSRA